MYGSLIWGVFPTSAEISWETHLSGAMIGLVSAVALRHRDVPPRKRYVWEGEADEPESPAPTEPSEPDGVGPA